MKQKRKYELYMQFGSRHIYSRSQQYRHGDWVAKVRATSIRQAYYLLGHRVYAKNQGDLGIVEIGTSDMKGYRYPWEDGTPDI